MLAPSLALAWATAYTFRMSQRAMVAKALGSDDDRVRELTREWALGLETRMHIEVRGHGVDQVDWSAPCVVMANRQSYLDVMALYRVLPRCFGFIAKQGLVRGAVLRRRDARGRLCPRRPRPPGPDPPQHDEKPRGR